MLSHIEINDKQQTINESMLKWIHCDMLKKGHISTNAVISIKYLYELTTDNRSVSQIIHLNLIKASISSITDRVFKK
jgi:hypothetical protein